MGTWLVHTYPSKQGSIRSLTGLQQYIIDVVTLLGNIVDVQYSTSAKPILWLGLGGDLSVCAVPEDQVVVFYLGDFQRLY